MTAVLEGGEWSAARPGRTLPSGKAGYPWYRRLSGLMGRSGRAEYLVHIAIRSRTVQSVLSRYTDWATGPTWKSDILLKFISHIGGTDSYKTKKNIIEVRLWYWMQKNKWVYLQVLAKYQSKILFLKWNVSKYNATNNTKCWIQIPWWLKYMGYKALMALYIRVMSLWVMAP